MKNIFLKPKQVNLCYSNLSFVVLERLLNFVCTNLYTNILVYPTVGYLCNTSAQKYVSLIKMCHPLTSEMYIK